MSQERMKQSALIGLGSVAALVVVLLGFLAWHGDLSRLAPSAAPPGPPKGEEAPAADKGPTASVGPSFDVVRVDPQGRTVIAGRAAPGSEVTVKDGDKVIGKVTADERGEWVLIPNDPLPPGDRQLSLEARSADGTTTRSDSVVAMTVPERKSAPAVAVLLPREGEGAARVLQLPGSGQKPPGGLSLDVIDYNAAGKVTLAGRAQPGTDLRIYLDNRSVGSATADASGNWSVTLADPVPVGRYRLRLDEVDGNGKVVTRLAMPFQRMVPPANVAGDLMTVVPGNSLWRMARRSYGSGVHFVEIYQANRDQILDPNLIYPGQIFAIPKERGDQSSPPTATARSR